jgi:hypothetical protein
MLVKKIAGMNNLEWPILHHVPFYMANTRKNQYGDLDAIESDKKLP